MPTEIEQLRLDVNKLNGIVNRLVFSDRYIIDKKMQFRDGYDIQFDKAVGTQIGTAADQLIGFYGTTPVNQPATISSATGCNGNADTIANTLTARLQELGLIA